MESVDKEMPVLKSSVVKARGNILVIEDDRDTAEAIATFLIREGYAVRWAICRDEAVTMLSAYIYDIIVMDYSMPGLAASEFIREARNRSPRSKLILITAANSVIQRAGELGLRRCLGKPFDPDALLRIIQES